MYMAMIMGWTQVMAFDEDAEKAKEKAIKQMKSLCHDDLDRWTWDTVTDYYGTYLVDITGDNSVITIG